MRRRHHQSPALRPDPLDIAGDVALLVLAILESPTFVGEDEGPEEDVADRIAGEDQSDITLGAAELAEPLQSALLRAPGR